MLFKYNELWVVGEIRTHVPFCSWKILVGWLIGCVLRYINPCKLFNAKSCLDTYIEYIRFGLVVFYGISTLVGYLMPNPLYTYIIIIMIIIMSCRKHGYPWPSLATSPCRSSYPAGLQGYIPYPHIAAGCMFELVVLLLLGHMWGSIGVHHLWARPCSSISVLHVWFV